MRFHVFRRIDRRIESFLSGVARFDQLEIIANERRFVRLQRLLPFCCERADVCKQTLI